MRTLLLLTLLACGDKEDTDSATTEADADTDTDTDTDADTDADPDAGRVQMTVSVEGAEGQRLVGFIWAGSPEDGPPIAAVCETIDSDSETITAVFSAINNKDPCDLTDPVTFEGGEYPIFAGTFTPGKKFPNTCTPPMDVTVDGDTEITMPALGSCQ
jgi:hypothetical protein